MPTDLNDPIRAHKERLGRAAWIEDSRNTLWGLLAMLMILVIGGFILYAPLTRQQTASNDRGAVATQAPRQVQAPLTDRTPGDPATNK